MKLYRILFLALSLCTYHFGIAQNPTDEAILAKIKDEGFGNSKAMDMLTTLSDVYGQRLTGTREYLAAAKWVAQEMKAVGITNVHFENYCDDCRGWELKSFNIEMTAPHYMKIAGYPLAHAQSTEGAVSGSLVHIESFRDMDKVKADFGGQLSGKIVLLGKAPRKKPLTDTIESRYSEKELSKMESQLTAKNHQTPLPELFESWEESDRYDEEFLTFVAKEGALGVLTTSAMYLGVLHPSGTYYYKEDHLKPLPYFTIMPEHFGRLYRMLQQNTNPTLRINLDTDFYMEADNNVNIIGEIKGTDSKLKQQSILIGAHFDSWHAGTGATDNGANSIVLVEALRILKAIGYQPKRTLTIGLWGGEEQAFLGSAAYAAQHFGALDKAPNADSKKVSAYLNLDNGAGAIRGVYLQNNELARPVFTEIFKQIPSLTDGALTIENTLSTDHETFDYYHIPAFQFIQDPLAYSTVTHHTNLDVLEYVPEQDLMKNAVILAWTLYSLSEDTTQVPRKTH